jgi:hypothetical protein
MRLSSAPARLILGAASAVAFVALSQRPTSAPIPTPEAAVGVDPTGARTSDGPRDELADAPTPSNAACDDGIAYARRTLARAEAELTDDDVLHVCTAVQDVAAQSASCASRVHELLATSTTCGRVFGAVASCSAPSASYSPAWTREMLTQATPTCRMRLVSSLHQARVVDAELLTLVSQMADKETVAALTSRIWLALGSLERTARSGSPEAKEAAARLDARIATKLHGASGYERLYMLEVAGNAACTGCFADVRSSLASDEPSIRRAAIAALRFREDADSLSALCSALDSEPNDLVREHAAWSLRWSTSNELTRSGCLERAVRGDGAENVRNAATQSLFALADRAPSAAEALSELTGESSPQEITLLAMAVANDARSFDPLADTTGSFSP